MWSNLTNFITRYTVMTNYIQVFDNSSPHIYYTLMEKVFHESYVHTVHV